MSKFKVGDRLRRRNTAEEVTVVAVITDPIVQENRRLVLADRFGTILLRRVDGRAGSSDGDGQYDYLPVPRYVYVNVFSPKTGRGLHSVAYPTEEEARFGSASNPDGVYHAIALPVERKD